MLLHVKRILRKAMRMENRSKVLVGDLNTDFERISMNRDVFQSILLEHRG